jgi:hypothetical protein
VGSGVQVAIAVSSRESGAVEIGRGQHLAPDFGDAVEI